MYMLYNNSKDLSPIDIRLPWIYRFIKFRRCHLYMKLRSKSKRVFLLYPVMSLPGVGLIRSTLISFTFCRQPRLIWKIGIQQNTGHYPSSSVLICNYLTCTYLTLKRLTIHKNFIIKMKPFKIYTLPVINIYI